MDQEAKSSVFDLIGCVVAFAFVALVALFGHPPARPHPAAMGTAQVSAAMQTISTLKPAAGGPFPEVPAMQSRRLGER
jgi:hypothetical protein